MQLRLHVPNMSQLKPWLHMQQLELIIDFASLKGNNFIAKR